MQMTEIEESGQAGAQITPAMLKAGEAAFLDWVAAGGYDVPTSAPDLVSAIWEAVNGAASGASRQRNPEVLMSAQKCDR
jgi:hypothetical protein